jgi:hypothetical protein
MYGVGVDSKVHIDGWIGCCLLLLALRSDLIEVSGNPECGDKRNYPNA